MDDDHLYASLAVLGVRPGSSLKELKSAYRAQIRACHPDRRSPEAFGTKDAEDRAKAVNQAYAVLRTFYRKHGTLPISDQRAAPENLRNPVDPAPYAPPVEPRTPTVLEPASDPYWRRWVLIGALAAGAGLWIVATPPDSPEPLDSTTDHASAGDLPTPEPAPRDRDATTFFTIGSTLGEVHAIQGVPTQIDGSIWHYGTARVYFVDGAVEHWENSPDDLLKARFPEIGDGPISTYFRRGSTKAEVRLIQGEPTRETPDFWEYGASRVYFVRDRVKTWYESPYDELKAKR